MKRVQQTQLMITMHAFQFIVEQAQGWQTMVAQQCQFPSDLFVNHPHIPMLQPQFPQHFLHTCARTGRCRSSCRPAPSRTRGAGSPWPCQTPCQRQGNLRARGWQGKHQLVGRWTARRLGALTPSIPHLPLFAHTLSVQQSLTCLRSDLPTASSLFPAPLCPSPASNFISTPSPPPFSQPRLNLPPASHRPISHPSH